MVDLWSREWFSIQRNTGKKGNTWEVNQGERIVKEVAVSFKRSGWNISMYRFFPTLPIAEHLVTWNLTLVGNLKQNKPYPYVPKKNKTLILLSTMHNDAQVSDGPHQKPEMILFYNKTKSTFIKKNVFWWGHILPK